MNSKQQIQPSTWSNEQPRVAYQAYHKVDIDSDWFAVYELPHQVYALYEPYHFQEVISFLILGSKKALLFDTGMGVVPIKPVIDQLTSQEVIVINSHSHFDHVGGNHEFSKVYCYAEQQAVERLSQGYTNEEVADQLAEYMFYHGYPTRFSPSSYRIWAKTPQTVQDGMVIDLGARYLKIIHTPGHSPDSIMLFDRHNGLLFTGDTFYPAALYAHFSGAVYGDSSLQIYLQTLEKLLPLLPHLESLYCSHNIPVVKPQKLQEARDAFASIIAGKATYKIVDTSYRKYQFDGFSVITQDR